MSSKLMNSEYPRQDQRYAICESQWKRSKQKSAKAADWAETVAEIEKSGQIRTEDSLRILDLCPGSDPTFDPTVGVAAEKEPYGPVEYADNGLQKDGKKRYPIDTEPHIRAAWSYINQEKNSSQYTPEQVAHIKARIISAWKARIDPKGPPSA